MPEQPQSSNAEAPPAVKRLGDELKKIRLSLQGKEGRPMTQQEMAERILVGGKGVVSLYESGKRIPDADTIGRYVTAAGGDPDVLLPLRDAATRKPEPTTSTADRSAEGDAASADSKTDSAPPKWRRRRVLIGVGIATVSAIAAIAGYVVSTSANGDMIGRVRITYPSPNQLVGYPAPLRGTVDGYQGWDLWLDIQSTDETRHHTTDAACSRVGRMFSYSQDVYAGSLNQHHVVFRITVVAVRRDSSAEATLVQYAGRDKHLPDAYRGTTRLPTGARTVASVRVVRR